LSLESSLRTVVAGLIQSRGRILACQRRRGDTFEFFWEFPGGKVQAGEHLEKALERELHEELGIAARIGSEVYRSRHSYPELKEPIELIFFEATAPEGEVRNLVFEDIQWREPKALVDLNFLPADKELVQKLATGEIQLRAENDAPKRTAGV
jgi:8-oxo-dGTP diphosphatase